MTVTIIKKSISIESINHIQTEIENINISKVGKNTTSEEELYSVLRFLQCHSKDINLTLPCSILVQDKPDIVLQDKYKEIGIEVTFAVNEAYQKAKMIRDEMNPRLIIEPSLHKNNKNRKYIETTIAKSNKKLYGCGSVDNELEIEISELILKSMNKKIEKFTSYNKFEKNFLLINVLAESFADEKFVDDYIQKRLILMLDIVFDKIIIKINDIYFFYHSSLCEK